MIQPQMIIKKFLAWFQNYLISAFKNTSYNKSLLRFYEFLSKHPSGNQFFSKLIPKKLRGKISYF